MQATTPNKLSEQPKTFNRAKTPRHKVADGIYPATLESYSPMLTNAGMRYRFVFTLDGLVTKQGEQITLQRTTSPSLAPKSHRRTIVESLLRSTDLPKSQDLFGNPDADFNSVPARLLEGVSCTIHVENQKNKQGIEYSNIENVFPNYKR
tara:strand:+ start:237 stop:686 length:450 start_codon:yes stop_codon:yes gene_type:complete